MTQLSYEKPVTEEELAQRARDKGNNERVSLEDVENSIESEHYLNPEELNPLTICVLRLKNGFMVIGHSASAMKENFDETIGRRLAREQAVKQIWQFLGFALRERLFRNSAKGDQKAGEEG